MPKRTKSEPRAIKAYSFTDVVAEIQEKARVAAETHQTNGGMCQHCGKNKADYPDGGPNPFHCTECNADTRKILEKLRRMGGFMAMEI